MEKTMEMGRNFSRMITSDEEWERRKREKELAYLEEEIKRKRKEKMQRALERYGLKEMIKTQTFDNFQANEPWQLKAKAICEEYAENPVGWLLLSGITGCGKTHLCTAVTGRLLEKDIPVWYMLYREDIERLKPFDGNTFEERIRLMKTFKTTDVLYIDDLFKGGATESDVRIMFELIDYRYRAEKRTIISTEHSADSLKRIDGAIAGRILQRSKKVLIAPDPNRNYRLKQGVV